MTSTAWLLLPDIDVDLGTYCSSAPNTGQTGHLQFTDEREAGMKNFNALVVM